MKESVIYQEWEQEITQRVRQEVRETIALNLLQENLPVETIADVVGLMIAQLQQLQASQPPKDGCIPVLQPPDPPSP